MRDRLLVVGLVMFAGFGAGLLGGLRWFEPAVGGLEVTSDPAGASVFLDGTFRGVTPLPLAEVPCGVHRVRIAQQDCREDQHLVAVTPRRTAVVHARKEAQRRTGMLRVRSDPPGAYVWLDGERISTSPTPATTILAGLHEVRVERPGWMPYQETVEVPPETEKVVSVKLLSAKVAYYEDAIARNPDSAGLYAELGRLYLLEGDRDKSLDMLFRGVGALARQSLSFDKTFHELLQALTRDERHAGLPDDYPPLRQLLTIATRKKITHRNCLAIWELLLALGRWKDIEEVSSLALAEKPADPVPFYAWRLSAAAHARDWKRVSEDFDALVGSGEDLSRLSRIFTPWGARDMWEWPDLLWAGAMARLQMNDLPGADAIVRKFRKNHAGDYWINPILAERWLKDPKSDPPEQWIESPPCAQPPEIDGDFSEAAWKTAGRSSRFFRGASKAPSSLQTTVLALHDAQHLYLGIDCVEPDPSHIDSEVRSTDREGAAIWTDSCIELFVDVDRDYVTYHQFIFNSNGAQFSARSRKDLFVQFLPIDTDWRREFPCAVKVDERGWRAEVALPFAIFGMPPPQAGDAWAVSIIRCRSRRDQTRAYFAPYASTSCHHLPRCFVPVVFR